MGVSNSEGAGASAGRTHIALATSHGFSGSYAATSHGCYASVLAGEGSGMQRDYASHTARHLSDLEAGQALGYGPDSAPLRASIRSRSKAGKCPSSSIPES